MFGVQVIPLSNCLDPFRSEGVLGINEKDLSLTPTLSSRQLSSDAQCVTQLSFARSELSKRFCDRHAFDASLEELVKLVTACRDAFYVLTLLENCHAGLEALGLNFLGNFVKFFNLCLRDTLDV